jgi:methyl-accepting chemotaxis protein
MRSNQPVTNKEILLQDSSLIVSRTDLKGRIVYVNKDFLDISGFTEKELIGQAHNIVRHPDMPEQAFDDMWTDLKAGRPWVGLVKNRCKNGDFYWVEAHAAPVWEHGELTGYMSARHKPSREQVAAAESAYRLFREKRQGRQRILHGQVIHNGRFGGLGQRLRDLPISVRFLLPSILALAVIMTLTVALVGGQITRTLNESGEAELKQRVQLVHSMIESTMEAVEREAGRLLDIYAARYPGTFSLETGDGAAPALRHNRLLVNGHHDEEDSFAGITKGPTATVLVRRGNEFVRIATSQKNDKGERVINTVLDKESPAVAKLLAGETYIGRTSSQGKDRISALKPIKDEAGQVVGAFGVGYFITQEMSTLRERVKAVKIGETGYVYVIDVQPGKRLGDLFIHPTKEGSNVLASKDASGREFIREMVERGNGVIRYPWMNSELGEKAERQKVVAFQTLERSKLLIGGGTYQDEFDSVSKHLYLSLIAAGLVVVIVLFLIMIWVSRRVIVHRVEAALQALRALSNGRYDSAIDISANDELGRVLQGLETMQNRIGFEVAEAKRQADVITRVKIGLDNVATSVRIADNDGSLLYINKALQAALRADVDAFRQKDPDFDPENMIGYNVGRFYDDPSAALQRLRGLTSSVQTQMTLGRRICRVTTTPIVNEQGERLGSVGEWQDITDQLHAEELLTEVIRKAANGDFSVRLQLDSRDNFFQQIEQLINQLLSNGESALNELSAVLGALSTGDLTTQISAQYQGVFGRLKDDTNLTVEHLKEVVGQIKEATDAISTAAKEIASGNQDLSGRTEQQASSLEETSSSMEELNATVRQNADNATQARDLVGNSNAQVRQGGEMVRRVVSVMSDIQESSHRIADIIGVIDGIAFQTNILALNAAVEAARAGEQGRGFAVVATEVRGLAKRSADAAKEIRALIGESVAKVDGGVKLVSETGATMDGVVESFKRITSLVTDIADASREQSTGIDQITHAVSQMDEVTQQNAALVEQAAAAAESLEEQAHVLADTVGRFKVAAAHSAAYHAVDSVSYKTLPPIAARSKASSAPSTEKRVLNNTPHKALPARLHAAREEAEWAEF